MHTRTRALVGVLGEDLGRGSWAKVLGEGGSGDGGTGGAGRGGAGGRGGEGGVRRGEGDSIEGCLGET